MGVRIKVKCLMMSERLSCSCNGFWGASEKEAGAHVTCRLTDRSLERIRRLLSNLVDSTNEYKTRKNATLTGEDRQGDVL